MVFHWSLSDGKSPQVSRTLLSILAVLNNIVVWMVSTRPLTSKSSSPFSNPLVTVPNAPITIGIIVTWMCHSFFNSRARSRYLSFFSHFSVLSCGQLELQSRLCCKFSSFCWLLLGLIFWPRLGDPLLLLYHSFKFFTLALACGILLEFEWQQFSCSPGLFWVFWPVSTIL